MDLAKSHHGRLLRRNTSRTRRSHIWDKPATPSRTATLGLSIWFVSPQNRADLHGMSMPSKNRNKIKPNQQKEGDSPEAFKHIYRNGSGHRHPPGCGNYCWPQSRCTNADHSTVCLRRLICLEREGGMAGWPDPAAGVPDGGGSEASTLTGR